MVATAADASQQTAVPSSRRGRAPRVMEDRSGRSADPACSRPDGRCSVQAFRRQGRRYGAGLVCSEMVSCAGIEHRNEKTLGYLRVAADEHPLAIQLFGSRPRAMGDAAHGGGRRRGHRRRQLRMPVKKVTRTGAGAHLLDEPESACRIVAAIAGSVDVPVTVKLRRGVRNGSRACPRARPKARRGRASSLTLHPRSRQADVHRDG